MASVYVLQRFAFGSISKQESSPSSRTMPETKPLDIKIIYSASKGRHRGTWRPSLSSSSRRRRLFQTVGVCNLILAGTAYYLTWWQADSWLYTKLMMHTPIPVDTFALDRTFKSISGLPDDRAPREGPSHREMAPSPTGSEQATTFRSGAPAPFAASVYGWEALTTTAICVLAFCGGTLITRGSNPTSRLVGLLAAVGLVAILAWSTFSVWSEYETAYKPSDLRKGMGGLVLLCASLGLTLGVGARGITRLAAMTIILAAFATVVALVIGRHFEAIKTAELPMPFWPFAAAAFVVQSFWGWVLWPLSSRFLR